MEVIVVSLAIGAAIGYGLKACHEALSSYWTGYSDGWNDAQLQTTADLEQQLREVPKAEDVLDVATLQKAGAL